MSRKQIENISQKLNEWVQHSEQNIRLYIFEDFLFFFILRWVWHIHIHNSNETWTTLKAHLQTTCPLQRPGKNDDIKQYEMLCKNVLD